MALGGSDAYPGGAPLPPAPDGPDRIEESPGIGSVLHRAAERMRRERWALWRADASPVPWQVLFTLSVLANILALEIGPGWDATEVRSLAIIALTAASLALAVAFPWRRVPRPWTLAVPVLDVLIVGLGGINADGVSFAPLLLFPVMWCAAVQRWRGVLIASSAVLLLYALPLAVVERGSYQAFSWAFSVLIGTVILSTGTAWLLNTLDDDRRRLAEAWETIARQNRQGAAIFEAVDVGLALVDERGDYVLMNERYRAFLALSSGEGGSAHPGGGGVVMAADGRRPLDDDELPWLRAARGEEFDDVRVWVGGEHREWRALSVSARMVRTADGDFAGAAVSCHDVSDLMRAVRLRDESMAVVSHDLRTPLAAITGFTELLEDEEQHDPERARKLEAISRNAHRLNRLVGDLLVTTGVDTNIRSLDLAPVDLVHVVTDAVAGHRRAAEEKHLELVTDLPSSVVVQGDAVRLGQVVDNLVSNAVKYTGDDGLVQVSLTTAGTSVVLVVRDSGIGIDPAEASQVFTPFYRAADAERRQIPGVGLGLSTTVAIVQAHGGIIDVESEPDVGSMFRVRLPLDTRDGND